jgi:tetratricopeptide (TPR) repeat protein
MLRAYIASFFLLPYLVIGNLLFSTEVVFAERFLYLPAAAFCLAAGMILEHIATDYPAFRHWSASQRFRYAAAAAVVLVAAFAFLTYARSSVRQDEESVFRAASWRGGARSHFMLGAIETERGNEEAALSHFRRAADSSPSYEEAWLQYGIALYRAGKYDEAEKRLRYALFLQPQYRESRLVLARVLQVLGRVEEADRENRKALVCPVDIDSITWRRRLPPWR